MGHQTLEAVKMHDLAFEFDYTGLEWEGSVGGVGLIFAYVF